MMAGRQFRGPGGGEVIRARSGWGSSGHGGDNGGGERDEKEVVPPAS